jgi:bromodomain-containing protein 7/9
MASSGNKSQATFPVGPAGRVELRRALVKSTDPAQTIQSYQQSHSLHAMVARAFNTVPRHQAGEDQVVESLDTDSVLTFLSHLGVSQHEVHKRISDSLRTQLEDEIRKAQGKEPLLNLLQSCWPYATSIPELRPVLWAVLKQLGSDTPLAVLERLAERDHKTGKLKHEEVWHPLPPLLKRLVWEADWDQRVGTSNPDDPNEFYKLVGSTLFGQQVHPIVEAYCQQKFLVDSANLPFVASLRERRMVTSHRRALTTSASTSNSPDLSKAVSQLRGVLGGETPAYRPKLLHAVLTILMARHGITKDTYLLGGAAYLHCTLVADILLSGPLPKAYQYVLALARTLDETVKEGVMTDSHIVQIQSSLRHIYPSEAPVESLQPESLKVTKGDQDDVIKDTLKKIITSALSALKDADPQSLFLNPVSDAIAPGYSNIIKHPMCVKTMESKLDSYRSLQEWERDVQLMYRNCITYNAGNAGQWFRGEARRQGNIFRRDIYPQAVKHYQSAMGKRSSLEAPKRKLDVAGSSKASIEPLAGIKSKKRKKDILYPSMPAVASMLLADPFVVRLLLDRALRCLRIDVKRGASLPAAHHVLPSLLQLLHLATWSTQLCAIRGKRYAVPDVGMIPPDEEYDLISITPYASLRRYTPLLMRLLVESELDHRLAAGGDLQLAGQTMPDRSNLQAKDVWEGTSHLEVVRALAEGASVHICQPGNSHESSLAITFPKFAVTLQELSANLWNERPFFISLIQELLRHKSKLSRAARNVVVSAWLEWLGPGKASTMEEHKEGSMTSAAHECFVMLLNEVSQHVEVARFRVVSTNIFNIRVSLDSGPLLEISFCRVTSC